MTVFGVIAELTMLEQISPNHTVVGGYGPPPSIINSLFFFEGTVTTLALFSHASEATVTLALTVQ